MYSNNIMNIDYPEYIDIKKFVAKHPVYLVDFAEYSYSNHNHMMQVYNILNTNLSDHTKYVFTRCIGHEINNTAGIDAMCGCFYMLTVSLILITQRNKNVYLASQFLDLKQQLEDIWHGLL